jgi:hypothetical protein
MLETTNLSLLFYCKRVGKIVVDAKKGRGRIAGTVDVSSSVKSEPQFLFASICNPLVTFSKFYLILNI